MKKIFITGLLSLFLIFGTVQPAKAATIQELLALLQQLQSQLTELLAAQQQSGIQTNTSSCKKISLTRDLTIGSQDMWDKQDVSDLQFFLKHKGFLDKGSEGKFDEYLRSAVAKYQIANGISPASGYVGPITRARINITCLDNIEEVIDNNEEVDSDEELETEEEIEVLYPNGGESLSLGKDSILIKFKPISGITNYINLINVEGEVYQLTYVKGSYQDKQSVNVLSSKIQSYNLPDGKYKIQICTDSVCDLSDKYFTLINPIDELEISRSITTTNEFIENGKIWVGKEIFLSASDNSRVKAWRITMDCPANVEDLEIKTSGWCGKSYLLGNSSTGISFGAYFKKSDTNTAGIETKVEAYDSTDVNNQQKIGEIEFSFDLAKG